MSIFKSGLTIIGFILFAYMASNYIRHTAVVPVIQKTESLPIDESILGNDVLDPYTSEGYYNQPMQTLPTDTTMRDLAAGALVGHLLTKPRNPTVIKPKPLVKAPVVNRVLPSVKKPTLAPTRAFRATKTIGRPSRPAFRARRFSR